MAKECEGDGKQQTCAAHVGKPFTITTPGAEVAVPAQNCSQLSYRIYFRQ